MTWNPDKPYHPPHYYDDNRFYFITARTFNRHKIWQSDAAKDVFVTQLQAATRHHGISLTAWAILHEHHHLLLYADKRSQLVPFIRRLHSTSAIQINRRDHTPGRKVWYNYWDYCPRDDRDFYRVFNYIHIQPIKHGILPMPGGLSSNSDGTYVTSAGGMPELHELLTRYEFASYRYYARKHGTEAMSNVWLDYPIPRSWEGDVS